MGLQNIQNLFGIAVFIAAVKSQINDFLRGVAQIIGVILRKISSVGVAHRSGALGLKGQAPVIGGSWYGGRSGGRAHSVLMQVEQESGKKEQGYCKSGRNPAACLISHEYVTSFNDGSFQFRIHLVHLPCEYVRMPVVNDFRSRRP